MWRSDGDLVIHEKAGERILEMARREANALLPDGSNMLIYKNNSDRKGNNCGAGEEFAGLSPVGKKRMKKTYKETNASKARPSDALFSIVSAAESQQKQKPKKGGGDADSEKGDGPQKLAKKGEKLKDEMDALVDEIDEVLEENAEEFFKNYVQRGGQ